MSKAKPAVLAASLALSVPMIAQFEGMRNDPYYDIVHVQTVCYGETRVPMRRYTDKECKAMLSVAVEKFAKRTLAATPTLYNKPYALAALTSLAYNIGDKRYETSTARRLMLKGDIKGGCAAIKLFNKAGGITRGGLVKRRGAEYTLCMKDA